jgi:hypothetical protein
MAVSRHGLDRTAAVAFHTLRQCSLWLRLWQQQQVTLSHLFHRQAPHTMALGPLHTEHCAQYGRRYLHWWHSRWVGAAPEAAS